MPPVCGQFHDRAWEYVIYWSYGGWKDIFDQLHRQRADRYYSVIYLSANDLFEVFSKNRFEYQAEEEMKGMYQYILDCDLLIIDDLGTELNNSFTSSQLFYCINERLNSSKSTIISTNHPLNELRDRYTERVTSRLISKYTIIPLYGDDIRLRKKAKRAD